MPEKTIPVMLHMPAPLFLELEQIAASKNASMRDIVVAALWRAIIRREQADRTTAKPKPGKRRGRVLLSEVQRAEVRQLTELGWSARELAARFKCAPRTITNIRRETKA